MDMFLLGDGEMHLSSLVPTKLPASLALSRPGH